MPLNGSGSYSAPASSWNPAVTNTTINSTDWAALLADITTALSTAIYKDGQQVPTANIPMGSFKLTGLAAGNAAGNSLRYEQLFSTSAVALLGAMDWFKGANIASSATINLTTATGNGVHVTGTVTITAVTLGSGMWRLVIFDGALTLTHHATNNNLPASVNITTAAGDRALYWSDGTTVYCVAYVAQNGQPCGPYLDTNPIVSGSGDSTKKVRLEVDGLTTATTRVLTVQDSDDTIVGRATTDTLTNKTLTSPVVNTGVSGTAIADQTAMEAASSATVIVTPSLAHFHPGVAKAWGKCTPATTVNLSYPAGATMAKNGTGDYTVTFARTFSSSTYAVLITVFNTAAPFSYEISAVTTTTFRVLFVDPTTTAADPGAFSYAMFGDL